MSVAELAGLQAGFGIKLVDRRGIFWRQVRPGFYRPMVPVQEYESSAVSAPCRWPGGFQYAVASRDEANSTMDFVMLDQVASYSLETAGHKRRNLIGSAARRYRILPLRNLQQLKDEGYRAFISFYLRTRYSYRSDRSRKASFDTWAETLFRQPKVLILGAFEASSLVAVTCSYWVNATLIYATFFSETEALRKNVGELLFHELRTIAAKQPEIGEILVRHYQGGNSLDQYYLLRGCKLVRKPARLILPGAVQLVLRTFLPRKYALIRGGA